jgi:hypothetical protein
LWRILSPVPGAASAEPALGVKPRGGISPWQIRALTKNTLTKALLQMNADAKLDAALGRHTDVALDHGGLDFDRAAIRVNDAAELDQAPAAGALDHMAMAHGGCGIDQIAAKRPEPRERTVFVGAGEPALADDIGDQDRCCFLDLGHPSGSPALRRPSTIRSKSFGFLYGITWRRCSRE